MKIYDTDVMKVSNVENIANTIIIESVTLNPKIHLMDFGSGTSCLLEHIAPFGKIIVKDISQSMNNQLDKKEDVLVVKSISLPLIWYPAILLTSLMESYLR